jgi:hypothetical protein
MASCIIEFVVNSCVAECAVRCAAERDSFAMLHYLMCALLHSIYTRMCESVYNNRLVSLRPSYTRQGNLLLEAFCSRQSYPMYDSKLLSFCLL